jgi:hypothetical protein
MAKAEQILGLFRELNPRERAAVTAQLRARVAGPSNADLLETARALAALENLTPHDQRRANVAISNLEHVRARPDNKDRAAVYAAGVALTAELERK